MMERDVDAVVVANGAVGSCHNRDQISRKRVALTIQVSSSLQKGGRARWGESAHMCCRLYCRSEWLVDLFRPCAAWLAWGVIWNF